MGIPFGGASGTSTPERPKRPRFSDEPGAFVSPRVSTVHIPRYHESSMTPIPLRASIERLRSTYASSTLDKAWNDWAVRVGVARFPADFPRLSANAYSTMCRTLRGFGKKEALADKTRLRQQSDALMHASIHDLARGPALDERTFDAWHSETCGRLQALWMPVFPLSVGQSQKWLNILLKYLVALGPKGSFPSIRSVVGPVGHAPIDSVVYAALAKANDVGLSGSTVQAWFAREGFAPWSKINDRRSYDSLQTTLRTLANTCGASAADLELFVW